MPQWPHCWLNLIHWFLVGVRKSNVYRSHQILGVTRVLKQTCLAASVIGSAILRNAVAPVPLQNLAPAPGDRHLLSQGGHLSHLVDQAIMYIVRTDRIAHKALRVLLVCRHYLSYLTRRYSFCSQMIFMYQSFSPDLSCSGLAMDGWVT